MAETQVLQFIDAHDEVAKVPPPSQGSGRLRTQRTEGATLDKQMERLNQEAIDTQVTAPTISFNAAKATVSPSLTTEAPARGIAACSFSTWPY